MANNINITQQDNALQVSANGLLPQPLPGAVGGNRFVEPELRNAICAAFGDYLPTVEWPKGANHATYSGNGTARGASASVAALRAGKWDGAAHRAALLSAAANFKTPRQGSDTAPIHSARQFFRLPDIKKHPELYRFSGNSIIILWGIGGTSPQPGTIALEAQVEEICNYLDGLKRRGRFTKGFLGVAALAAAAWGLHLSLGSAVYPVREVSSTGVSIENISANPRKLTIKPSFSILPFAGAGKVNIYLGRKEGTAIKTEREWNGISYAEAEAGVTVPLQAADYLIRVESVHSGKPLWGAPESKKEEHASILFSEIVSITPATDLSPDGTRSVTIENSSLNTGVEHHIRLSAPSNEEIKPASSPNPGVFVFNLKPLNRSRYNVVTWVSKEGQKSPESAPKNVRVTMPIKIDGKKNIAPESLDGKRTVRVNAYLEEKDPTLGDVKWNIEIFKTNNSSDTGTAVVGATSRTNDLKRDLEAGNYEARIRAATDGDEAREGNLKIPFTVAPQLLSEVKTDAPTATDWNADGTARRVTLNALGVPSNVSKEHITFEIFKEKAQDVPIAISTPDKITVSPTDATVVQYPVELPPSDDGIPYVARATIRIPKSDKILEPQTDARAVSFQVAPPLSMGGIVYAVGKYDKEKEKRQMQFNASREISGATWIWNLTGEGIAPAEYTSTEKDGKLELFLEPKESEYRITLNAKTETNRSVTPLSLEFDVHEETNDAVVEYINNAVSICNRWSATVKGVVEIEHDLKPVERQHSELSSRLTEVEKELDKLKPRENVLLNDLKVAQKNAESLAKASEKMTAKQAKIIEQRQKELNAANERHKIAEVEKQKAEATEKDAQDQLGEAGKKLGEANKKEKEAEASAQKAEKDLAEAEKEFKEAKAYLAKNKGEWEQRMANAASKLPSAEAYLNSAIEKHLSEGTIAAAREVVKVLKDTIALFQKKLDDAQKDIQEKDSEIANKTAAIRKEKEAAKVALEEQKKVVGSLTGNEKELAEKSQIAKDEANKARKEMTAATNAASAAKKAIEAAQKEAQAAVDAAKKASDDADAEKAKLGEEAKRIQAKIDEQKSLKTEVEKVKKKIDEDKTRLSDQETTARKWDEENPRDLKHWLSQIWKEEAENKKRAQINRTIREAIRKMEQHLPEADGKDATDAVKARNADIVKEIKATTEKVRKIGDDFLSARPLAPNAPATPPPAPAPNPKQP